MTAEECILTDDWLKYFPDLKVGDNVSFSACFTDLWGATARVYNDKITAEGYPESSLQTETIF